MFKRLITIFLAIYFIVAIFAGIERIVWANTDYCIITNNIVKINEENKNWLEDFRCMGGWEIIRTDSVTKYRCGMWFPNTVNVVIKNKIN